MPNYDPSTIQYVLLPIYSTVLHPSLPPTPSHRTLPFTPSSPYNTLPAHLPHTSLHLPLLCLLPIHIHTVLHPSPSPVYPPTTSSPSFSSSQLLNRLPFLLSLPLLPSSHIILSLALQFPLLFLLPSSSPLSVSPFRTSPPLLLCLYRSIPLLHSFCPSSPLCPPLPCVPPCVPLLCSALCSPMCSALCSPLCSPSPLCSLSPPRSTSVLRPGLKDARFRFQLAFPPTPQ